MIDYRQLPKVELHLHLDGSLPSKFIAERAKARNISIPVPAHELRDYLHEMKVKVRSAGTKTETTGNWSYFDFCNQFLQTAEELIEGTMQVCHQLISDGVWYAEIRFCPTLHTLEGLTETEVVKHVVEGFEKGCKGTTLKGGIIICALRSYSVMHSIKMVNLCKEWIGRGVVGFDVAGHEGTYPLEIHEEAVRLAVSSNIPVTVHAGEWANTESNIILAVNLGVDRIGHGITVVNDTELLKLIASKDITVECCLTSNVGSGRVKSYEAHPIRHMFDAGIKVTVSSDNLLLSGSKDLVPSSSHEIERLITDLKFGIEDIKVIVLNAIYGSFGNKLRLLSKDWIESFEAEVRMHSTAK